MAAGYTAANLHQIVSGGIGGGAPAIWTHHSADAASLVQVTGYITDGGDRGMKVGDVLLHTDDDATPNLITSHTVVTVSSTAPGAVDLTAGVSLTGSNSD